MRNEPFVLVEGAGSEARARLAGCLEPSAVDGLAARGTALGELSATVQVGEH